MLDQEKIMTRKEYVMNARNAFTNRKETTEENIYLGKTNTLLGVRLLVSVMLFAVYLVSAVSGMKIFSFAAQDIEKEVRVDYAQEGLLQEMERKLFEILES